jgi:hypothetical protein
MGLSLTSTLHPASTRFGWALSLGDREDGQEHNVQISHTATVKADTIFELEAIEAELTKAGATILRITTTAGPRGLGGQ